MVVTVLESIFIFQINSSMVPLIKKASNSNKEFRNFYTLANTTYMMITKKLKKLFRIKELCLLVLIHWLQ